MRNCKTCSDCSLSSRCVYAMVFETETDVGREKGGRVSAPPHPMVFVPPEDEKTGYEPGDGLVCGLKVFGSANDYLPYFVHAFERMGKAGLGRRLQGQRGRFVLERVEESFFPEVSVYENGGNSMTRPENLKALCWDFPETWPAHGKAVRIVLDTPLRLKVDGRLPADLPFDLFVRQALRRMSSLFNAWGDGEPELDYPEMIRMAGNIRIREKNLRWFDWQRYSNRQESRMFMGGLTGDVLYEGDLTPFLPLLSLAEALHVGKNTMFGLGRVRMLWQ
ncbi:CRISPR system precrRNA processing endoribonuclease RAMP protein Cas6 [Desulfobotulus alkaliphilus]|uniref:CRISPR system precrRNA processing endoribonuclease RAMP protein Cas6 n=1 Tax=Desulfobotulus alkaliphilus TaxID=622671 RepID=UPI001646487C|nr:CRISPR system precrRNA processing endoribonuclease RAMP protein Cas6 [Desulfobotulus alkaliphilus]